MEEFVIILGKTWVSKEYYDKLKETIEQLEEENRALREKGNKK